MVITTAIKYKDGFRHTYCNGVNRPLAYLGESRKETIDLSLSEHWLYIRPENRSRDWDLAVRQDVEKLTKLWIELSEDHTIYPLLNLPMNERIHNPFGDIAFRNGYEGDKYYPQGGFRIELLRGDTMASPEELVHFVASDSHGTLRGKGPTGDYLYCASNSQSDKVINFAQAEGIHYWFNWFEHKRFEEVVRNTKLKELSELLK